MRDIRNLNYESNYWKRKKERERKKRKKERERKKRKKEGERSRERYHYLMSDHQWMILLFSFLLLFSLSLSILSLFPEKMGGRERKRKSKEASALSLSHRTLTLSSNTDSLIEQWFGWIVDHDRKWLTWMILSSSFDRHLWEWDNKEEKEKKKKRRLSGGIDWNDVLLCDIQLHRNQWKTRLIQFLIKLFSFFLFFSLSLSLRRDKRRREREKRVM